MSPPSASSQSSLCVWCGWPCWEPFFLSQDMAHLGLFNLAFQMSSFSYFPLKILPCSITVCGFSNPFLLQPVLLSFWISFPEAYFQIQVLHVEITLSSQLQTSILNCFQKPLCKPARNFNLTFGIAMVTLPASPNLVYPLAFRAQQQHRLLVAKP